MKKIAILLTGLMFSMIGYGQSDIGKQIRDPQRKTNAGKADGIIARKKNVLDSTTFYTDTSNVATSHTKKKRVKTKQPAKANAAKKGL